MKLLSFSQVSGEGAQSLPDKRPSAVVLVAGAAVALFAGAALAYSVHSDLTRKRRADERHRLIHTDFPAPHR